MKLIDKYLLRQFMVPLSYCLVTFCMIFIIFDLFDHMSDFIEAKTPFTQIVRYYAYVTPALMVFIAPISLLLGILYSLWQLTRHNELIAMRASGLSFGRIIMPYMCVGFLFSVGVSTLQETVAPWSSYWANQFIERQKRGDDMSTKFALDLPFKNERQQRNWVVRKFDLRTFKMEGVKVVQQRPDGSDQETVTADSAEYLDGRWWLFNVRSQKQDFYNNPVGPTEEKQQLEMADWDETPTDFMNEVKDPMFLSSRELWNFMRTHRNLAQKTCARITVDMHSRLSMPWTCLVVTLFGIPCGVHTARRGAMTGIMTALLSFFGFYVLMTFCQWLGKNQMLQPVVSAWIPNAIFFCVGLFMLARTR